MNDLNEHKIHILPLGTYLSVGVALFILTIVTVYISMFDFSSMNLVIAMIIAAAKASIVALFFMHLKYDNKIYSMVLVGALLFLAVFIILTMFDTLRRDEIDRIKQNPINPNAVIYQQPVVNETLVIVDSLKTDSTKIDTTVSQ